MTTEIICIKNKKYVIFKYVLTVCTYCAIIMTSIKQKPLPQRITARI